MPVFNGTSADELIIGTASGDTISAGGGMDFVNGSGGDDTVYGQGGADLIIDSEYDFLGTMALPGDRLEIGEGLISANLMTAFVMQADGNVEVLQDLDNDGNFRYVDAFGSDISGLGAVAIEFRANGQIEAVDGAGNVLATYGLSGHVGTEFHVQGDGNVIFYSTTGSTFSTATHNMPSTAGVLSFASTNDRLNGGDGDDIVSGGDGADRLKGDDGNDTLFGGDGADVIYGGNGDDYIEAGLDYDTPDDAADRDRVYGGDGDDTMFGGNGNDTLHGDENEDVLIGGTGRDYLVGGRHNDSLYGEEGNDTLVAGHGDDYLEDDLGRDSLNGGSGNDTLIAGAENDRLVGGSGNDSLVGGSGWDKFHGGSGDDTLEGGSERDRASFSGSILDHTWVDNGDGTITITDNVGSGGTDILDSIEILKFHDTYINLDRDNAAMIEADDVTTTEDDTVTFTFTSYDFDGGTPTFNVASAAGDGGTLTLISATPLGTVGMGEGVEFTVMYDPGDVHQDLREGELAREEITLMIDDGQGNTATEVIDLTVTGATDVNFVTEAGGTADASEDDVTVVTGHLDLLPGVTDGDVTYSVQGTGVSDYGTMTIDASGNWTYTLDNASSDVQDLLGDETVLDDFVFEITDGTDTDVYEMDVTITGEDEAVAAGTSTFEDLVVTGNSTLAMPDGYAGVDFSAEAVAINTAEYRSGAYDAGSTSGDIAVMTTSSAGFTLSADDMDSTFDLETMFLTSVSRFSMEVTATAYLDGVEIGSQTFDTTKTGAIEADFNDAIFDAVDEVVFTTEFSSGGRFLIDDMLIV